MTSRPPVALRAIIRAALLNTPAANTPNLHHTTATIADAVTTYTQRGPVTDPATAGRRYIGRAETTITGSDHTRATAYATLACAALLDAILTRLEHLEHATAGEEPQ